MLAYIELVCLAWRLYLRQKYSYRLLPSIASSNPITLIQSLHYIQCIQAEKYTESMKSADSFDMCPSVKIYNQWYSFIPWKFNWFSFLEQKRYNINPTIHFIGNHVVGMKCIIWREQVSKRGVRQDHLSLQVKRHNNLCLVPIVVI